MLPDTVDQSTTTIPSPISQLTYHAPFVAIALMRADRRLGPPSIPAPDGVVVASLAAAAEEAAAPLAVLVLLRRRWVCMTLWGQVACDQVMRVGGVVRTRER